MWISSLAAGTASSEPVAPWCKYVFRAFAGCLFHGSSSCSPPHTPGFMPCSLEGLQTPWARQILLWKHLLPAMIWADLLCVSTHPLTRLFNLQPPGATSREDRSALAKQDEGWTCPLSYPTQRSHTHVWPGLLGSRDCPSQPSLYF